MSTPMSASLTADDRFALLKTFSFVREKRHNQKNLDDLADRFDRLLQDEEGARRLTLRKEIVLFSENVKTPLTLNVALQHVRLRNHFRSFVEQSYAGENLAFVEAVDDLGEEEEEDLEEMVAIVREFCDPKTAGATQINLPDRLTREILGSINDATKLHAGLIQAKRECLSLMQNNFFHRFLSQVIDTQDDPLLVEHD